MSPVLVRYEHFLGIASRLQWDAGAIDLGEDARRWPRLEPELRACVSAFVAGFTLAEQRVALDLQPFVDAAPTAAMADCFRAQAHDEARHARFFDRYVHEVLGVEAVALRDEVEPGFADLFVDRLGSVASGLARGDLPLAEAVGLYHLILEGVVFSAGQNGLLAQLQVASELPGLRVGLEQVIADERWHIGFGVRVLRDRQFRVSPVAGEAEAAVEVWGDLLSPDQREAALRQHRRRLSAAGLAA